MLTVQATIEVWDDDAPEWHAEVTEYGEGDTTETACWAAQDAACERFGGGSSLRATLLDWKAA